MRFALRYQALDMKLPEQGVLLLGRDPSCHLCFEDPITSRQHARLTVAQDGVWVEDLGSRNGVWVNGKLISEPTRLTAGDWLRVGRNELGFRMVPRVAPSAGKATGAYPTMEIQVDEVNRRVLADEFASPPKTEADLQRPDPLALIRASGERWLANQAMPMLERFSSALNLVELLSEASADEAARTLLGEALDLLGANDATGVLPPTTARRAHAHVDRLSASRPDDTAWSRRKAVLDRAEGLLLKRSQ